MQALKKPEGSTEGNSFLTARNVYDWRKKPYPHEGGTTSKMWKRRSRLVAREFAVNEGKRDDTFSPATSGHALKLLPCRESVKRKKQERGEGTFSQMLGCLDVKDAFLQVPQETFESQFERLRGEGFW